MTNGTENNLSLQQRFAEVFARLPEQDIEQFYAHYQLWLLRRRVPTLEGQIAALQAHIEENQRLIHSLQPSAVALAVLARLRSNGVSDVAVLDQMLERGEDWLDRMMQRLDYCEQVEDFIQGDYTQWCVNSLEGAYDWIDTMLGSAKETEQAPALESVATEAEDQATEELLLRKLKQDDEEETPDVSLKQPAAMDEQAQLEGGTERRQEIPLQVAEQFLMAETGEREEAEESTSDSEVQQSPALLETWTDLEAPPERPAPWYSVNLAEGTSAEATHPEDMNDWIEVLQADTVHMLALKETTTTPADSSEVARPDITGPEAGETDEEEPAVQQPVSIPESDESGSGPANAEPQIAEEALEALGELPAGEQSEIEISETSPSADEEIAELETGIPDHIAAETPASTEEETLSASVYETAESELTEGVTPPTVSQEEQMPEAETASAPEPGESTTGEANEAETAQQNVEDIERNSLAVDIATTAVYQTTQETSEEPEISQEAQAAGEESVAEAQGYEETVIVGEEETHPWYEYLAPDKQATQAASPRAQEESDYEQSALATTDASIEHGQPAQQEHRETTENAAELVFHEKDSEQLAVANEDESFSKQEPVSPTYSTPDLVSDAASQDDDATLPMALKEIQRAREAQLHIEGATELTQNEPEAASEGAAPTEGAESNEPTKIEITAPTDVAESEAGTPPAVEQPGEPRTQEAREPAPSSPIAPVIQAAPQPPIPAKQLERQQPQSAEPPKRRGFWQRLFGWMRRK